MKETKSKYHSLIDGQTLSSLVVGRDGKLKYAEPPLSSILKEILNLAGFMAWYVFAGLFCIFLMSFWGLLHPDVAITHAGEVVAYIFLVTFSAVAMLVMAGLGYFFARRRIIGRQ